MLRVVALSGGYNRPEACAELARNRGVVASFSRALLEDLRFQMSDAEFDGALASAIDEIYKASTQKVAAPSVIPWTEAAKWYNANATVEGVITRTANTGRVIYLDFSPRNSDMKVVIFPQDAAKFPQPPEKMYQGKKIQVTGKIQEYQGAPEIIVRSPAQIKIVE